MKNILLTLSVLTCFNMHATQKRSMGQILMDKMQRPPAISGRIVPTTLGNTGFFWYKLEPDHAPVKPRVYDPGPVINQLIDQAKKHVTRGTTSTHTPKTPITSQPDTHVIQQVLNQITTRPVFNNTTSNVSPERTKPTTNTQSIDTHVEPTKNFLHKYDLEAVRQALEWQSQPPVHPDLRKVSRQEMREFRSRMDEQFRITP